MAEKTSAGAGNQRDVRALQIRYAATCLYSVLMSKIRITRTKMTPKGFEEIVAVIIKNVFPKLLLDPCKICQKNQDAKRRRKSCMTESKVQTHCGYHEHSTRKVIIRLPVTGGSYKRTYTNGSWRRFMVDARRVFLVTYGPQLLLILAWFSLIAKRRKPNYETLCCIR